MKHTRATLLFIFRLYTCFAFIVSGCSTSHVNLILSQDLDPLIGKKDLLKMHKESASLWHSRNKREDLDAFIALEVKIAKQPSPPREDIIRLARAHHFLAEYLESSEEEKAKHFALGSDYAEKALIYNAKLKEKILVEKLPPEQALNECKHQDAEALYWYAINLEQWAEKQGLSTLLKYKERVKKMIDRVAELSPELHHGAVYRYYGIYYAQAPGFANGDTKKSKTSFDNAVGKYPEFFANHVLYAEHYATKMDDQALFKKQLTIVINGNPKLLKEYLPEQTLEQEKAKRLLERKTP